MAHDAASSGEVVYLTEHGRRVAAVVTPEVTAVGAAAIEALEDAADAEAVRRARAALEAGEPTIPWSELKAELGL